VKERRGEERRGEKCENMHLRKETVPSALLGAEIAHDAAPDML
jgi:hypothetical protein